MEQRCPIWQFFFRIVLVENNHGNINLLDATRIIGETWKNLSAQFILACWKISRYMDNDAFTNYRKVAVSKLYCK